MGAWKIEWTVPEPLGLCFVFNQYAKHSLYHTKDQASVEGKKSRPTYLIPGVWF